MPTRVANRRLTGFQLLAYFCCDSFGVASGVGYSVSRTSSSHTAKFSGCGPTDEYLSAIDNLLVHFLQLPEYCLEGLPSGGWSEIHKVHAINMVIEGFSMASAL